MLDFTAAALKQAAANSDLEAVQTLLDQHGDSFSEQDLSEAYDAAQPHYVPEKFGNHTRIKAKLLLCSPGIQFFSQLAERGDSDLPYTLHYLPVEYINRLSLESNPTILQIIGEQLHSASIFLKGGHEDFTSLVKKLLQFDNRLLMQWAVDSNKPKIVDRFIKIGVNFREEHHGKIPLEVAKERANADMVKVLLKAHGESARMTADEWRELLIKEDELLRQSIEAIITQSSAHQIRIAAHAALQPSGLLLSAEQLAIVEEYFKDASKYKYSKDDKVPYSVVRTQEGELVAIFSEREKKLKSTRVGSGFIAKVKYGQILKSQEFCAIKIVRQAFEVVADESTMLKPTNLYKGLCLAKRDDKTNRSFLFMTFVNGISWREFDKAYKARLKPRHQAQLFHNLLIAIQHLCKNNIDHGDCNGGNFMINPKDFSFTFVDFGQSILFDPKKVSMRNSIYTQALTEMITHISGHPELLEIYNQLQFSDDNILTAIEKALIETQAIIAAASELPAESMLQPQPPLLLSNPLQQGTNKRPLDDDSELGNIETSIHRKQAKKCD